MRLSPEHIHYIRSQVHHTFGVAARVWLFGSRVDDARTGGDVDLYIEPDHATTPRAAAAFRVALQDHLQLPVDTVIALQPNDARPICAIARLSGVPL